MLFFAHRRTLTTRIDDHKQSAQHYSERASARENRCIVLKAQKCADKTAIFDVKNTARKGAPFVRLRAHGRNMRALSFATANVV